MGLYYCLTTVCSSGIEAHGKFKDLDAHPGSIGCQARVLLAQEALSTLHEQQRSHMHLPLL